MGLNNSLIAVFSSMLLIACGQSGLKNKGQAIVGAQNVDSIKVDSVKIYYTQSELSEKWVVSEKDLLSNSKYMSYKKGDKKFGEIIKVSYYCKGMKRTKEGKKGGSFYMGMACVIYYPDKSADTLEFSNRPYMRLNGLIYPRNDSIMLFLSNYTDAYEWEFVRINVRQCLTIGNFVLFKKWILNVDGLKLVDSASIKQKNNIWDVSKEGSIWEENSRNDNSLFPVMKGRAAVGFLKIENGAIIFLDKAKKKPKWQYKIPLNTHIDHDVKSILFKDSLYISLYSPISSGSTIVCINVTTGKNIWNGEVRNLENIIHSQYMNEVFISKMGDNIILAGEESGGNLLQVIDSKTGKNLFYVHD